MQGSEPPERHVEVRENPEEARKVDWRQIHKEKESRKGGRKGGKTEC